MTSPPAGPPPWMQRATRQAAAAAGLPQDEPSRITRAPCIRCIVMRPQHAAPEPDYHEAPPYADADREPDPSRYDDALYGQLDPGAQHAQHDPAYADDPYAYQDGYDDGAEEPVKKRRGGMVTVVVVLALAVVGTGAAFAYRTYVGSPRSGEPPIIRADNSPTKIVPAPVRRHRQGAGPHGDRRWHREDRSARRSAGRRQCQVRSARGVSAAEPERQSAVGGERGSWRSAAGQRRQWHAAEQRAAQDQDP